MKIFIFFEQKKRKFSVPKILVGTISNCSNFKAFANFLVGSKAESQELYLVYGMPKETGCISIAAEKNPELILPDTESRKLAPNSRNQVEFREITLYLVVHFLLPEEGLP